MTVLVFAVPMDLGEAVHELEEDEFFQDLIVFVEAAVHGAVDGRVGDDDALPQFAHPQRVQEVAQVRERLVVSFVLWADELQVRAEAPVDLGDQAGIAEAELEVHGLSLGQGVMPDEDVAVLIEAADAESLGVLAHQERVVEGRLRVHERLQPVTEALRRQRGLALADFQLGRRPDPFLLRHGSVGAVDFLDLADDDAAGVLVFGEMDPEGEAGFGVEDVVAVRHLDEFLLEVDRLLVRMLPQGEADAFAIHFVLLVALSQLASDIREEEQLFHEQVMGVPAGALHAGLDRSAGHLDEVGEGLVAEFAEELGQAARVAGREVLVLAGEPGLRAQRDLVADPAQ